MLEKQVKKKSKIFLKLHLFNFFYKQEEFYPDILIFLSSLSSQQKVIGKPFLMTFNKEQKYKIFLPYLRVLLFYSKGRFGEEV